MKAFDLRSWLTGFALGLSGKPLPLNTGKKLVGYSYNGTVLPKLPEWDKTVYPYAVILYNNVWGHTYFLFMTKVPANIKKYPTNDRIVIAPTEIHEGHSFRIKDGAWVGTENPTENDGVSYSERLDYGYSLDMGIWTNHNVYYADDISDVGGTLFMAASEPVPVYE